MGLHMIELPDDLVEWIRSGHGGIGPRSAQHVNEKPAASILIEAAIERPMVCGTCTLAVSVVEGTALVCRRWGGACVTADGFCSQCRAA